MSNMSVRPASVARLCAVQKIVPPLPTRKLSRTLSDVAPDGAEPAGAEPMTAAIAALMPMTVLRMVTLRSQPAGAVVAAGHRLLDRHVEGHRTAVDQAGTGVDLGLAVLALFFLFLGFLVGPVLRSVIGA